VDTDRIITERYGSIPDIFAQQGEPWFREREAEVIRECLDQPGVLSLGGGAVITESTRVALRGHPVVLFMISEDAVSHRVEHSDKRPLLSGGLEAWKALVEARMPWYRECSEWEVDVSHRPVDDVAAEVVSWLESRRGDV
jgi:shikimate kinase